jgi:hypothetical protein
MHDTDQPQRTRRLPRLFTAAALGLLTLLASVTLIAGTSGTASAAAMPASATVTANNTLLSPEQATQFTQYLAAQAVTPSLHPSCVDGACGVELSPSETLTVWRNVVNKPITWVRNYCRGLFGGALRPFCDAAAQFLSNLSAPNGRCLFVGVAATPTGGRIVVKYTQTFCF